VISIAPVKATSTASLMPADYKILSGKYTVTGPQLALFILVEFQDVHHNKSPDEVKSVAIDQLNTYYNEVSYGKVSITGQVYGWYTINHPIGYYGHDKDKPGDDDNLGQLAKDAVAQLPSSVDLGPFKYLVVVHAGQDQADDQYNVKSDEIWSQCYCAVFPNYEQSEPVYTRGKTFTNYVFLSEFNGVGTFAHEWGHLFGLPDLYDTKGESSYVGFWSLMDNGNSCCYNEAESTPSYIGGWGDALLGWLSPTVVESSVLISSYELKPLESPEAGAIMIPVSGSTYYFIEYRTKTGQDIHLPDSGALIYFVNEYLDTGGGILKLVNPRDGKPFNAQEYAKNLNDAVFKTPDQFKDIGRHVYLGFLGGSDSMMTLYSTQELTGSFAPTSLKVTQTSLSGMYSEHMTISGTLLDQNGVAMLGQNIEVNILDPASSQWQNIASGVTDPTGSVTIGFDLTYAVGGYTLRLLFPGGKSGGLWYTSSNADLSLNILPAKMTITLALGLVIVDKASFDISVVGVHGEPLKNVFVTVYLNNVPMGSVATDENGKGILVLQFGLSDIGPHTITAEAKLPNYAPGHGSVTMLVMPLWLLAILVGLIAAIVAVLWKMKGGRMPFSVSFRMVCPGCGARISRDSDFCSECGTSLTGKTTVKRRRR
jgi:M6 family metalloprotease-like protein